MQLRIMWIAALTAIATSALCAQDLAGNWQGTLKTGIDLRLIVEIAKGDDGGWKGYDVQHRPNHHAFSRKFRDAGWLKSEIHGGYGAGHF